MLSLTSPPRRADDGARPQHRLDADHLRPHGPVAHHVDATGVGGDHPADGRRIPGSGVDAERQPRCGRVGVQRRQRHAGARGHLAGEHVDRAEVAEPSQAEHHLRAGAGDRPADQARVPTLWHQRDPVAAGRQHQRPDLIGRRRADHRPRHAAPAAGPVDGVPLGQARVGENRRFPERGPGGGQEGIEVSAGGHRRR